MYILGPQERKDIYVRMLEDFKADVKYTKLSGLCIWLTRLEGIQKEIEYYPELMLQKPDKLVFGCYWWGVNGKTDGRKRRIEALKRAIKLVNKLL